MFHNKKIKELEEKIAALDKKYAKIWIEQMVIRLLWIAGGMIASAYFADVLGVWEKIL